MDINQKSINELKFLSAQIVSNANSGHTGTAVGASSILYALFKDHLFFNPLDPKFLNRDRFIMSAGHASALYYAILHMFGFNISSNDLKNFRKLGSITPGHPEVNLTPGVEVSTGPLGQGIANAVGFAIAEAFLESKTKKFGIDLINNYTYCFAGDGCLMEGVAMEACSLAGTLCLNRLILLYDNNDITIDGTRQLANDEDIELKFQAMNWNVLIVKNGHSYKDCSNAIKSAKNSKKPTIIIFKTRIGDGTALENSPKIHAYPMPKKELDDFKKALNVSNDFSFSEEVKQHCQVTINSQLKKHKIWLDNFIALKNNKIKYNEFQKLFSINKINFESLLTQLISENKMTGRDISSFILNFTSKYNQLFIGGAADLAASTKAEIIEGGSFSKTNYNGRNIHFGIREHAMGAICNGISLYCNQPTFNSTFLAFSNYMIPALRMSAMMQTPTLSIFTHDSINIGQDGPTHQPIEQLGNLRSIIGLQTFRPATKTECVAAFKYFFDNKKPTSIIFSKSNLIDINKNLNDVEKGGYTILEDSKKPDIVIISTGTDIELAINIAKQLKNISANVVSIPCEKLFDSQPTSYKNKVLPKSKLKVVIEASNDQIWFKYLTENDLLINVKDYQYSGNGSEVYKSAGFNEAKIINQILKKLK